MGNSGSSYYQKHGLDYVRVTAVTALYPKPALLRFYGKHGTEKAEQIAREASDFGTRLHSDIIEYTRGGEVEDSISLTNFIAFCTTFKVRFLNTELTVFSDKYKYAGTLDAIIEMNGKAYLVDWKTSSGIYPDYLIQVEAYYRALKENNPNLKLDGLLIVRLDKTTLIDYTESFKKLEKSGYIKRFKPSTKRFKAFQHLLGLFNYIKGE